jgi:hypothetical protein
LSVSLEPVAYHEASSADICRLQLNRKTRNGLLSLGVYDLIAKQIAGKSRPVKTWGPVDVRGHAMFGWPMEEEAKFPAVIVGAT